MESNCKFVWHQCESVEYSTGFWTHGSRIMLCDSLIRRWREPIVLRCIKNQRRSRCISSRRKPCISSATCCGMELARSAVWNQHEVMYGINPKENARWRVMPYAYGDYILTCGEITYQSFGLDKKRTKQLLRSFFGGERGIRTLVGVLAQTRFPVVRLRPAQPSLHGSSRWLVYYITN